MSHCEPDFICSVVNDTKVRVKFVLFFDLSEETMQARIVTHERSGLVQNCWEKTQSHLKNLKPRVDHHFPIFPIMNLGQIGLFGASPIFGPTHLLVARLVLSSEGRPVAVRTTTWSWEPWEPKKSTMRQAGALFLLCFAHFRTEGYSTTKGQ